MVADPLASTSVASKARKRDGIFMGVSVVLCDRCGKTLPNITGCVGSLHASSQAPLLFPPHIPPFLAICARAPAKCRPWERGIHSAAFGASIATRIRAIRCPRKGLLCFGLRTRGGMNSALPAFAPRLILRWAQPRRGLRLLCGAKSNAFNPSSRECAGRSPADRGVSRPGLRRESPLWRQGMMAYLCRHPNLEETEHGTRASAATLACLQRR